MTGRKAGVHTKTLLFHHPGNSEQNVRIIQKNNTEERQKKKGRKECVNTEENKKLGVSSFTSFCLFSLKAATGHLP